MKSEQTPRQRKIMEFIESLNQLDAGGRARLRRNAGRTLAEARDVHRVFFQIRPYDISDQQEEDYFLVATLFPLATYRAGAGTLGATLRRVRAIRGGAERANSLDRRVQALIDSEREQLPFRLRQVVRLAASSDQFIDWARLLSDLLAWDSDTKWVQLVHVGKKLGSS